MKKMFTILAVLCVLLGMSGCSTRRTYKTEDYEIYDLISELDEFKREAEEDYEGVSVDYDVTRGFDGKYTVKLAIAFGEHNSEWKSRSFTIEEFMEGFDCDPDELFTYKVDGKKYDYATAMVLLEHYSEGIVIRND